MLDSVNRANEYVGRVLLRDIDSDMVQQMIYDLAKQGYSESIMTKAKQAAGSVLKMAAAKHYLDSVPVIDVIIPSAKNQDVDRLAKNNWMRDDEIRAYEEECKRTYVPKKYTKYASKRSPAQYGYTPHLIASSEIHNHKYILSVMLYLNVCNGAVL